MIDSVRTRLTLWYVAVLAGVLVAFTLGIYLLMTRALHSRVDSGLHHLMSVTQKSLIQDAAEGQSLQDAARSTVSELSGPNQALALFDEHGQLLASNGWDEDFAVALPAIEAIASGEATLSTGVERDGDDRVRLATQRLTVPLAGRTYFAIAGEPLDVVEDELESLRIILWSSVPIALILTGISGWFLARKSLAPVVAMAERADRIGAGDLGGRLPVANPRDELGRLAETFNRLLARMAVAFTQQQRFMADASHELRTPIATARTAAAVTLQQPHRAEEEYRQSLQIVQDQSDRLARIVDDMLTLARADAGEYPLRTEPLYLNELVDEVARDARVLSARAGVRIDVDPAPDAPFVGDEHLLKRLIMNLVDNAIRHTPAGGAVRLSLAPDGTGFVLTVSDTGGGIPHAAQAHIFERFYRSDASRIRRDDRGAGLGLAIARWIAEAHAGTLELVNSSSHGTVMRLTLP
jgi:two-component system, OmpR family, sensor kinase